MCKRRKIWILCAAMCSLAGMLPVQAGAEGSSPDALIVKKTYLRDYDEGTWETYGTGTFQTAGLSAEDEAAFPGLAAAIRQDSDALREELTALYEESCADARVARSEYEHEYEAAVETKILARRSDAQVVSFLVYEYTYMGGAHGYYFYTGYNYGTSTGEKLSLEQIVADPALFVQVIGEKVEEKYPGHVDYSLGDPLDNYTFSGGTYEYNYCLDPDGVLIIFNPYEIAAYASGVLTV